MKSYKKSALGRGLDALISIDPIETQGSSSIQEIQLSLIKPNGDQPRRDFDDDTLLQLASSIKSLGIIQPITLREETDGTYQIIAGERRYRASKLAQLESIPAYIRKVSDETLLEMALVENIQREDLNAIEIALTYQRLIDQYQLTQESLSERIGKSRSSITNFLRLLKLPAEIQVGLTQKRIDMGHARALLPLTDAETQLAIYETICTEHLSVRKVEEIVKQVLAGEQLSSPTTNDEKIVNKNEEYHILKQNLSSLFKTKIQFTCNDQGKGKISIPFKSEADLERIIQLFEQLQ